MDGRGRYIFQPPQCQAVNPSRWSTLPPPFTVVLWLALRNYRAVCPDCGHGPMGGNVGWTRESFILWAGVVACFLAALWGTFHLALLLALLFTW